MYEQDGQYLRSTHTLSIPSFLTDPLTHDSFVAALQQVTVECIVIRSGKWAEQGYQAGLMNITYSRDTEGSACSGDPLLRSSKYWTLYTG